MVIATYNVNGIRAAVKKGLISWIKSSKPDVLCLQEMKAEASQIPEELQELGYHLECHSAQKKGYSGVAIMSRQKPLSITAGIGIEWIDCEGRVLSFEFPKLKVYSIYVPSGTSGEPRQELKMRFLEALSSYTASLKELDKPILLCGDFNIAHQEIDIHDPIRNKNSSGFLPEERKWFSDFLSSGFSDLYRDTHPNQKDTYSWWTYRAGAKSKNKGWRIDYQLGSPELASKVSSAIIERELDCSDHVPVTITYAI